jgi:hypothetical protein
MQTGDAQVRPLLTPTRAGCMAKCGLCSPPTRAWSRPPFPPSTLTPPLLPSAPARQYVLPMLRSRQPGSHPCIAEWLLLQGSAGRLPHFASLAPPPAGSAGGAGAAYEAARAAFVERWSAPARYAGLNALEKVRACAVRRVGRVGPLEAARPGLSPAACLM